MSAGKLLRNEEQLYNATKSFVIVTQQAAWATTLTLFQEPIVKITPCKLDFLFLRKRRLRRIWHQTRFSADKKVLNNATQQLKR